MSLIYEGFQKTSFVSTYTCWQFRKITVIIIINKPNENTGNYHFKQGIIRYYSYTIFDTHSTNFRQYRYNIILHQSSCSSHWKSSTSSPARIVSFSLYSAPPSCPSRSLFASSTWWPFIWRLLLQNSVISPVDCFVIAWNRLKLNMENSCVID